MISAKNSKYRKIAITILHGVDGYFADPEINDRTSPHPTHCVCVGPPETKPSYDVDLREQEYPNWASE